MNSFPQRIRGPPGLSAPAVPGVALGPRSFSVSSFPPTHTPPNSVSPFLRVSEMWFVVFVLSVVPVCVPVVLLAGACMPVWKRVG